MARFSKLDILARISAECRLMEMSEEKEKMDGDGMGEMRTDMDGMTSGSDRLRDEMGMDGGVCIGDSIEMYGNDNVNVHRNDNMDRYENDSMKIYENDHVDVHRNNNMNDNMDRYENDNVDRYENDSMKIYGNDNVDDSMRTDGLKNYETLANSTSNCLFRDSTVRIMGKVSSYAELRVNSMDQKRSTGSRYERCASSRMVNYEYLGCGYSSWLFRKMGNRQLPGRNRQNYHDSMTNMPVRNRTGGLKDLYHEFKKKLPASDRKNYRNLDHLLTVIENLNERKKKSQKNTLSVKAKKMLHSECELRRRTAINLGLLAIADFIDKSGSVKKNKKKIIFGALQLILQLKLSTMTDH